MQIIAEEQRMLEEIVYTTVNHTGVYSDTKKIADALGMRHADVMKKADRLGKTQKKDVRNFSSIFYLDSYNREQRMWQMDKAGTLALLLSFKGEKFDRLRLYVANKFVRQEQELISWKGAKGRLKQNHITFTDKIKPLAELLKAEGSKNFGRTYSNIQLQVNKAVTGRSTPRDIEMGTYRENLPIVEIEGIIRLEDTVFIMIDHWLKDGLTGRQTRESVKNFLHSDLPKLFLKA